MLVKQDAYNKVGGLHRTTVIDKHLVDWYIPFLPLEKKHVERCIVSEAQFRNSSISLSSENIQSIVSQLIFKSGYSSTGCKTIAPKIDVLIEEMENFDGNVSYAED